MNIAIYQVSNGSIQRRVRCPADHVALQCAEGEEFFLNCPLDSTHILNGEPSAITSTPVHLDYRRLRMGGYPLITDYLDAKVKQGSSDAVIQAEGLVQEQAYIAACLTVKAKHPKPS